MLTTTGGWEKGAGPGSGRKTQPNHTKKTKGSQKAQKIITLYLLI